MSSSSSSLAGGGGSSSSSNKRSYFTLPSIRTISDMTISAVDRVADERTRKNAYNAINNFCRERPVLASFITLQLLFSLLPILFFTLFTLSITSFCLLAAISVILFWTGITLFITFCIVSLLSLFACGVWCYLAVCWYVAKYVAGYFGIIDYNNGKKGRDGALVRRERERSFDRVNNSGYGYTRGVGGGHESENGGGGKKVVFDVKTGEDENQQQQQQYDEDEEKDQDKSVNGTVEVKKEEGVDREHTAASVDSEMGVKGEDEKHRQVREESPSQHSEGDYLDIRSGGRG